MGDAAQILLVTRIVLLTSLLVLSPVVYSAVNAAHYHAFWLWAAVRPQPVLHQAETLYLHQGEITRRQGKTVFLRQGIPVSKLHINHLWLTYRVSTLNISEKQLRRMLKIREKWLANGNQVAGIQIDFDARSYELAHYVTFLQTLRRQLPTACRLSVTGLLDWAKTGDIKQLNRLNHVVDELVVQTYQGRHTINNYRDYLPALLALKVPFRIGLIQHGRWDERWQYRLAASPFYRGEAVFLINPVPARRVPITH